MHLLNIEGVPVSFPFEPYPCQIDYMRSVIKCLQGGQNGILESPTGTGKTLCLLCASLAWLEAKKAQISSKRWEMAQSRGNDLTCGAVEHYEEYTTKLASDLDSISGKWSGELGAPKIIYASRTHSQLSQAISELKRTAYKQFKVSVLGSREQLCIHPQVMKEQSNATKVHLCRAKVQNRSCYFYNNVENTKAAFTGQVLDIEDLVTLGGKKKCCPYYMARELKGDADIIFMPYNYLLDPKSRKAHGVELPGNIVIFDEAHNLEQICEDSTSCDLSSTDIAGAIRDLQEFSGKLMDLVSEEQMASGLIDSATGVGEDINLKEVLELKAMLHHLEEALDEVPVRSEQGLTKPGRYIFELLGTANLNFTTKAATIELIDKIVTYLTSENAGGFHSKGTSLSKFCDVVKIVFSRDPDGSTAISHHQQLVSKHFKVHIQEETRQHQKSKSVDMWASSSKKSGKQGRVLSYWCFSPGHAMQDLQAHGIKCIILTSGTLSPLSSFSAEMGIEFPIQLENPHVIEKHQVWIGVVGKGPDSTLLSSAYNNRFREDYMGSLGNAIVNFSRAVPNGLLLFFPSYPVMEKCVEHWQKTNVWNRIEQYKPVFVEPKRKTDFQTAMMNFYEKVNDPKLNGAIFAAVCRGKVSEGLDFTDNNGRAVVITGLPYPPKMDPKVQLKMQFLDEAKVQNPKGLSSFDWYKQQAYRAVNQAVGRVIRHRHDYGAIILCDNRFGEADAKSRLPSWLRQQASNYPNFGIALRDIMGFFKTAEKVMPLPQGPKKQQKVVESVVSGAHFELSMSRSLSVSQASRIEQHVPSMRPCNNEELSLAKMKVQYEQTSTNKTEPRKKSLFDALDNTEKEVRKPEGSVLTEQNTFKKIGLEDKSKKKKILIKSSSKSDISKASLQSAEAYIAEVKKTLSQEGYKTFSKTLAEYKKTADFNSMVNVLASLFTDVSQNYHLFQKFYRFIKSSHKQQYDQICKNLTGLSCADQIQQANSGGSKRKLSDDGKAGEKRSKLEVLPDIAPQGVKSAERTNQTSGAEHGFSSSKSGIFQKPGSCETNVASCSSENVTTEGPSSGSTSSSSGPIHSSGLPRHQLVTRGYTCCKCRDEAHIPLRAQCQHVCCLQCWKDCISQTHQCPECKAVVKRKHLQRICFASGPNIYKTDG